ncbi:MAG: hypothetical protein ACYDDB_03410, partial [bacterium]
ALPSTNTYNAALNDGISAANTSVSLSNTLTDINYNSNPQSFTFPPQAFTVPVSSTVSSTTYSVSANGSLITNGSFSLSYLYSYAFPTSTTQSDTLILVNSSSNLNITGSDGNPYYGSMSYSFTGDASGHNTVDVDYQASGNYLPNYLVNATNFQTLDFNYNGTNGYAAVLNLNSINSGFDNFVLDSSDSSSANSFTFNNATNNDTFVVEANTTYITIDDAIYNTTGNVIMDGVQLSSLDFNGSTINNGSTLNIESTGAAPNGIQGINFTDNPITLPMTINVTGSQDLTIGQSQSSYSYSSYSSMGLNDGNTLNVNDNSTGTLTLYFSDTSTSTNPNGVTINASGSSGTLNIYDLSFDLYHAPNTIILGSGTDNVFTDNGNSVITAGSGQDTITVNTSITANYSYSNGVSTYTSYSGYIPDINNANSNTFITFSNVTSAYPIQFESAQLNETSATSLNNAMLNALNAAYNLFSNGNGGGDFAVWFEYGNNTYIVNNYNGLGATWPSSSEFQIVKLTGTVNLTNATASAGTIHI